MCYMYYDITLFYMEEIKKPIYLFIETFMLKACGTDAKIAVQVMDNLELLRRTHVLRETDSNIVSENKLK